MKVRIGGIAASIMLFLSMICVLGLDEILNHRHWLPEWISACPYIAIIWIFMTLSGLCFLISLIGLLFWKKKPKMERVVLLASLILSMIWPIAVSAHHLQDKWRTWRDREYKLTMKRINEWAIYWVDYYTANATYLPPGQKQKNFAWGNVPAAELMEMFRSLPSRKVTVESLAIKDAWGWDLQFCVFGEGEYSQFAIRSPGKDGKWDANRYEMWPWGTGDYDRDIVFANGQWIRWQRGEAAGPGPVPKRDPGEQIIWFPDIYTDSP